MDYLVNAIATVGAAVWSIFGFLDQVPKNRVAVVPKARAIYKLGDEQDIFIRKGTLANGQRVTLVKNEIRKPVNRIEECVSEESAKKQAREMGLGLEPVFHKAHEIWQKDHYHIHDHCYIRYDDHPYVLHNFHFTFGQKRQL